MNKILSYVKETPFFKNINTEFNHKNEVQITNTNDSISFLTILNLFDSVNHSVIVVAPNLFNAQKVYDNLSNYVTSEQIGFFPQDEFMTTEMLAMSTEFKVERINTIRKIINKNKMIIVTNTTGLIKYLLPKRNWEQAIIKLQKEEEVNIKNLLEKLITLGYKREETVEKQGDFAYRGGLLDIYPLNEINPLRIEFFDDEIESIRYFDINTQRSTIKTDHIDIFPLYEFHYTKKDFDSIESQVNSSLDEYIFDDKSKERIFRELENLEHHNEIDKLARYINFLHDKPETLIDYIDNKTIIYWDYKRVKENYSEVVRDITDWYASTGDYPKLGFKLIKELDHIYTEKSLYMDVFGDNKRTASAINVRAKEPTIYNNNVHMLINDLKKYIGFTTVILTFHNDKILRNFIELIDEKLKYHIIGNKDNIIEKQLNLVVCEHSFSFEMFDINTIVLNEENLFKQKDQKKGKYRSSLKDAKKLSNVEELKKGDLIVHYDHGIGRFLGVETMTLGDMTNDYIHIGYKGDDSLFIPIENVNLLQKYIGSEGSRTKIHKLGGADWAKTKQRVRKKVKDIADKLIKLYAEREAAEGFQYSPESDLQIEFEADFPYQETPDQLTAIEDVKRDMESSMPMDRLLCGDVGYGKTEVALRAAFKAVLDNKQVAYLAPTTVLTRQHYYTFKDRLTKYGIRVGLLNRFVTKSVQREVMRRLSLGELDIVIGTHRLLSKDIVYHDLGLLIIDEEQRFGVEHKEKIKEMKINIDVLSLSATPIPRTLQMAIMGVKSMSLLETPPLNRYPIQTYVMERNDSIIRDAVQREMARNGQIFYLYNRVDDINVVARKIEILVPEARVVYAHGKMGRQKMEEVIQAFIDYEYDVLVSTTIIETGIDIPNANTLVVHDSDRLGLSQLYQIRGRVGRSDRIAYAYLMYRKNKQLTEEAVKRLKVIKEFTELGSGFKIAIRDLSIRGAGDVLGTEQSGFMDSVGLDLFMSMLKEEVNRQNNGEPEIIDEPSLSPIKIQVNKYIDSNYIKNDYIKIEMHRKIANIESKQDIEEIEEEMNDRFGLPSKEINLYMYEKLFEHLAKEKGIEKIFKSKTNVIFTLNEESSKNINTGVAQDKAHLVNRFIRFEVSAKVKIIIDTVKLNTHYIYPMVDLLEII